MTTLGSIYHDFPRLAKQSGFYFQLHKGRVNWSEIENLNMDDIIENRDYHLLERNLINVINCNLEREYDLKILDQNFVKLFKLAQLGIDYLSYCEMYLDKCVVLLQEQLTAFQEEYDSLKQNNGKRKEDLNKSKRKNRTQSYQCDKCEKVFISDVYLKFHDKRRHSNPNTPSSLDTLQKKCIDSSQQTEDETKLSISTQTLYLDELATSKNQEDRDSMKCKHTLKIDKLEQELKDLKERLKKTESSLIEKSDNSQLNHAGILHPVNVTGSVCCNPMLMLLPSYIKQPNGSYYEIPAPGSQSATESSPLVNLEPVKIKPPPESKSELNHELQKAFNMEYKLPKEENDTCVEKTESFQDYHHEEKKTFVCDKENIDPNLKKNTVTNLTKPLPPPRKLKRQTQMRPPAPEKMTVEAFTAPETDILKKEETDGFSSHSIIHRSTPIKENTYEETGWEMIEASRGKLSGISKAGSNSTESLNSRKSFAEHHESKSFFKTILDRNSPKLRRLGKNLKRSLTNLYDSVSSTEKDLKKGESTEQNVRAAVVTGLNNRLVELGVDPEWQRIPKKTMKQKLNILKHRQKLLTKENPMFPVIRQNIEEKIFQKIKSNLGKKKTTLINKLTRQGSTNLEDPPASEDIFIKDSADFIRVKQNVMYGTDTDSESKTSDSECNFNPSADRSTSQKSVVVEELTSSDDKEEKVNSKKNKEFDFSVFQVGGGSLNSLIEDTREKNISVNKSDQFTDSDTEDNSTEHSDFKTLKSYLNNKNKDENSESGKNYDNTEQQLMASHTKVESHGILKDESLQSKLSTSAKKRVLFAKYSDGIEEELSDSPNDDLWPFKSDSEKDVG